MLDDIEYVKYSDTNITASNTVQKPFRSAILSGQTLVNVSGEPIVNLVINSSSPKYLRQHILKKDTMYTFIYDIEEVTGDASGCWGRFNYTDGSYKNVLDKVYTTGITKVATSFDKELNNIYIGWIRNYVEGQSVKFKSVMILEGDWTDKEIPPYFEGMQSVKMPVLTTTGKNLWSGENITIGKYVNGQGGLTTSNTNFLSDFIKVKPNTTYAFKVMDSRAKTPYGVKSFYDENKNFIGLGNEKHTNNVPFTTPSNCHYVRIHGNSYTQCENTIPDCMLIETTSNPSTIATYEPYKTNILSTLEDVELCGVGDIKDTLNCNTGEYIKRINSIVLDESGKITLYGGQIGENTLAFRFSNLNINPKWVGVGTKPNLLCTTFPTITYNESLASNFEDKEGICLDTSNGESTNAIVIRVLKSRLISEDVAGIRDFISKTKIDIVSEAESPVVKTVDLKVVDQDGNPVNQLSAFDSTTHIISDSESDNSLIAIAEVEVPTKLIEALNAVKSLSSDVEMLINEVDNAQKLQDENSTMVMSAMTELYEMVLVMGGGS